jgi:ATP-dependent exoDNAse (exonuclease V) alpha subunit
MSRIVVEVLKAKNARMILVGDHRQHQSVGPGGVFAALCSRLGSQELTEIIRQRHEEDRHLVEAFRDKKTAQGIKNLVERGRLHVGDEVSDSQEMLVKAWGEDKTPYAEKRIIASTNNQVDNLNARCQALRASRGELSPERFAIKIKGDFLAHPGDRILLRKSVAKLDVSNGDFATVLSSDKARDELRVKLDDGGRVVTIPVAKYGRDNVSLGYAATSFLSQGASYESVYLFVHGNMSDAQMAYVMGSRHRQDCVLYTTIDDAGENLTKLVRDLGRDRTKFMAHDVPTPEREQHVGHEHERGLEHPR